jgi:hypothetical protein
MSAANAADLFLTAIANGAFSKPAPAAPCNCGVCVMSQTIAALQYEPFPETGWKPPEPVPYVKPTELPLVQRIALLIMRTQGELPKIVLTAAQAIKWEDFTALVEACWATRQGKYHRLTISGTMAADQVARDMARQLGIHHKIVLGDTRYYSSMACTCGRTFSMSKNEGNLVSQKMRAWSRHLTEVEEAKAKGIPYVAPELRVSQIIENAFKHVPSPPTQPEEP